MRLCCLNKIQLHCSVVVIFHSVHPHWCHLLNVCHFCTQCHQTSPSLGPALLVGQDCPLGLQPPQEVLLLVSIEAAQEKGIVLFYKKNYYIRLACGGIWGARLCVDRRFNDPLPISILCPLLFLLHFFHLSFSFAMSLLFLWRRFYKYT